MTHCICSKMIAKSIHSSTADWTNVDVEEEADPDDAPFPVFPIPVPVAPVPVPDPVLISDPPRCQSCWYSRSVSPRTPSRSCCHSRSRSLGGIHIHYHYIC